MATEELIVTPNLNGDAVTDAREFSCAAFAKAIIRAIER